MKKAKIKINLNQIWNKIYKIVYKMKIYLVNKVKINILFLKYPK